MWGYLAQAVISAAVSAAAAKASQPDTQAASGSPPPFQGVDFDKLLAGAQQHTDMKKLELTNPYQQYA